MSIREAARFYNISSNALVRTCLERFEKSGIKKDLFPVNHQDDHR
ncbi:hypothetical protein [Haemophilus parainfluenzae]